MVNGYGHATVIPIGRMSEKLAVDLSCLGFAEISLTSFLRHQRKELDLGKQADHGVGDSLHYLVCFQTQRLRAVIRAQNARIHVHVRHLMCLWEQQAVIKGNFVTDFLNIIFIIQLVVQRAGRSDLTLPGESDFSPRQLV